MADQTAQEIQNQNVAKMGNPLGSIYSALWQEVATLHAYWLEYVALYGTKPERIDLLNRAAPHFFRMIQDGLWEGSLLHLARLTDPPYSGGPQGKPNLSIQALIEFISDAKLKVDVEKTVGEALRATEFARDWRNRHIAHRDLKLALEQPTTALADASRAQVWAGLRSIANVLNLLAGYYFESETAFEVVTLHNGSITLLYLLRDGLQSQDERFKRLKDGKPLDGDFDHADI